MRLHLDAATHLWEELDVAKKIKALNKKLRQIDQIKAQLTEGKALDPAQLEKLAMVPLSKYFLPLTKVFFWTSDCVLRL